MKFAVSLLTIVLFSCQNILAETQNNSNKSADHFLTVLQFQRLAKSVKNQYIQELRTYFVNFESSMSKGQSFAEHKENFFLNLFFPAANAQNKDKCLIGGVEQPQISGKCSTKNNECDGKSNSFKCGVVFGNACINRTPVESISQRCFIGSADIQISGEQFGQFITDIVTIKEKYCTRNSSSDSCVSFLNRASQLKDEYLKSVSKNKSDQITAAIAQLPSVPLLAKPASTDASSVAVAAPGVSAPAAPVIAAPVVEPSAIAKAVSVDATSNNSCQEKSRDLLQELNLSTNIQTGKATLLASAADSREIWSEYIKLSESCTTDVCKEILNSQVFNDEMDPNKFDSTLGVLNGFKEDINVLSQILNKTSTVPKSQRKASDLDALFQQLGWKNQKNITAVINAYLNDDTFEVPSTNNKAIFELLNGLGRSRFFRDEDNYTSWLNNGLKKLNEEEKRIQNVYIFPKDNNPQVQKHFEDKYGKNLTPTEREAADKMKSLLSRAYEVTTRSKESILELRSTLNSIAKLTPDCLKTSGLLSSLESYDKVRTRCGGNRGTITTRCGGTFFNDTNRPLRRQN